MQLVMGLGNPGERYAGNRHNVGFRCLELVAGRLGLAFMPEDPTYLAAVGDGPGGPLTLLKPLTYMNRSGQALAAWVERTGVVVGTAPGAATVDDEVEPATRPVITPVVPVVVCDDIHLPLGSLRIRAQGSDGGQNGLASVIEAAGGPRLPRLRLGVGPRDGELDPANWADYVLQDFAADEQEAVDELLEVAADALLCLLESGPEAAGSRFNRRFRPQTDLPRDP